MIWFSCITAYLKIGKTTKRKIYQIYIIHFLYITHTNLYYMFIYWSLDREMTSQSSLKQCFNTTNICWHLFLSLTETQLPKGQKNLVHNISLCKVFFGGGHNKSTPNLPNFEWQYTNNLSFQLQKMNKNPGSPLHQTAISY